MAGWSVLKPLESVATRFVVIEVFISSAIPKACLKQISKLQYFKEHLFLKWTRRPGRGSGSGINIDGGERVVPLGPLSLIEVGSYNRLFASQSTVLV